MNDEIQEGTPLLGTLTHQEPSKVKTWTRIILVFIANVFCTAPLTAFPTLQPLFANAGVFGASCGDAGNGCQSQTDTLQTWYAVSTALSLVLYYPSGPMFDKEGPLFTAVFGGAGVTIGMVLFWAGIQWQSLNWILWIAYPFVSAMGSLNSFALMGFIFHVPSAQGTLIGLSTSSSSLSGALVFMIVFIVQTREWVSLSVSFLICAALSFIGTVVCFLTPGKTEYRAHAARIMGTELPNPSVWGTIRDSFKVVFVDQKLDSFVCLMFTGAGFFLADYTISAYFGYWSLFFSPDVVNKLTFDFSLTSVVIPACLSPFTGMFYDQFGITVFCITMGMSVVLSGAIGFLQSFPAQLLSIIFVLIYNACQGTFAVKWGTYFCPELIGSYFAILVVLMGAIASFGNWIFPIISHKLFGESILKYQSIMLLWTIICFVSMLIVLLRIYFHPNPPWKKQQEEESSTNQVQNVGVN